MARPNRTDCLFDRRVIRFENSQVDSCGLHVTAKVVVGPVGEPGHFYPIPPGKLQFRIEENFEIHYGELTKSYGSLAGRNFVSQHCPDLSNAQGESFPHHFEYSVEVNEYSLRCLGSSVSGIFSIRADVCLEHGDEVLRRPEDSSALRTFCLFQEDS